MPQLREHQRDSAGAGANVENWPAVIGGKRAPTVKVGFVGAALEVVPDSGLGDHANDSAAAPRATSSSRTSSIAV